MKLQWDNLKKLWEIDFVKEIAIVFAEALPVSAFGDIAVVTSVWMTKYVSQGSNAFFITTDFIGIT